MIRSIKHLPKTLALLVISSCMVVPMIFISAWRYQVYISESKHLEQEITERARSELGEQLKIILSMTDTKRSILATQYRAMIKTRVTDIHAILSQELDIWESSQSMDKLKAALIEYLETFNESLDRGELIVFDAQRRSIFYPSKHFPLGTSLMESRDADGRLFIRELIPFILRFEDSLEEIPMAGEEADAREMQLVYLRCFRPLYWFIGNAIPMSDMDAGLQKTVLQILQDYRYKEAGYIITMNADGFLLSHGTQPQLIGRNGLVIQNDDGVFVGKEIMQAAAQPNGGFCRYTWYNPVTGKPEPKLTFGMQIPDWGWTVATGVYLNEITASINVQKKQIKRQFINELIASGALWLVFSLGAWLITRRVQQTFLTDFTSFGSFFEQAANNDQLIVPETLSIK